MQWKSSIWVIWKSNENRMTSFALIIPCYKQVVTSWLWSSGKYHSIHSIFTNCCKMAVFFHHHLIGWKSLEKGLKDFGSQYILFPSIPQNQIFDLKRGRKLLQLMPMTVWAEAEYSLLHTMTTFPTFIGKSLNFWCLIFFMDVTLLGVHLKYLLMASYLPK